jgi:ABC-type polysaccharide/polyol phosphate export permease
VLPSARQLRLAVQDLRDGASSVHLWPLLAWQEIRHRYQRSVLGPFWITISTGVFVAGMGPLYGRLLGQPLSGYFVYVAIGFVVWQLLANLVIESCQGFVAAEGFIKQMKLPLTVHVLRVVWKNFIIFAHNLVIIAIVLFFFPPPLTLALMLFPLGLLLIGLNAVWVGLLLGLLCARFRDIPPMITNLVQVALFLTPIMWKKEMLGRYEWTADLNPFHHFIEIVRAPLLGQAVPRVTVVAILVTTLAGYTIALLFFAKFRARIAYWV